MRETVITATIEVEKVYKVQHQNSGLDKYECANAMKELIEQALDVDNVTVAKVQEVPLQGLRDQIDDEIFSKWIPVTDHYPASDDYILLSFSNFSLPMVGRYEVDENGGAFYVGDDDSTCVSEELFVNAWMPLPKPFKPKGE